jgi:hypothetical protein
MIETRETPVIAGIVMVDLFDAICPVDPCAPVIGNVLIYLKFRKAPG